jgi:hypothetical protein
VGIKRKKDLDNIDSLSDFGSSSEYPYDHEHGHEHDYHHFDDRHIESLSGNIEENPGLNFEPERRRRQRRRRRLLDLEGEELLSGSGGFIVLL